jgi:hypothetical protein
MSGLTVDGVEVATYISEPELDIRLAPRPYLHPVRTLGGTVVTDELPQDHPWHLGVSLTMQDVDGVNVWGGRTYVRDEGYVWRDDHGRVLPVERHATDGGFAESLHWYDGADRVILREHRTVTAAAAPYGWDLSFSYALSAPAGADVLIGSPATNGRTGGAGYGGFFWRATEGKAVAFTATGEEPHGSAAGWLALTVDDAYTLVFRGLRDADRWFARTSEYNGVCAALAYTDILTIPADKPLSRDVRVLVADGALSHDQIEEALAGR